ncbi:MAG: hypothetical protein LH614_17025 [Pyrinomonadaceae bacterium]|nr:hypothetical protein [Pyrinomonadaceae bacterium]
MLIEILRLKLFAGLIIESIAALKVASRLPSGTFEFVFRKLIYGETLGQETFIKCRA